MNYTDNGYHFRQDSTFLYFFGLNRPSLAGILDCETGEEMVFGNDPTFEEYKKFGGLRNEEDFLITETGCELLGKSKPKSIADVEDEWAK